jgi:hypothetical protein
MPVSRFLVMLRMNNSFHFDPVPARTPRDRRHRSCQRLHNRINLRRLPGAGLDDSTVPSEGTGALERTREQEQHPACNITRPPRTLGQRARRSVKRLVGDAPVTLRREPLPTRASYRSLSAFRQPRSCSKRSPSCTLTLRPPISALRWALPSCSLPTRCVARLWRASPCSSGLRRETARLSSW